MLNNLDVFTILFTTKVIVKLPGVVDPNVNILTLKLYKPEEGAVKVLLLKVALFKKDWLPKLILVSVFAITVWFVPA